MTLIEEKFARTFHNWRKIRYNAYKKKWFGIDINFYQSKLFYLLIYCKCYCFGILSMIVIFFQLSNFYYGINKIFINFIAYVGVFFIKKVKKKCQIGNFFHFFIIYKKNAKTSLLFAIFIKKMPNRKFSYYFIEKRQISNFSYYFIEKTLKKSFESTFFNWCFFIKIANENADSAIFFIFLYGAGSLYSTIKKLHLKIFQHFKKLK